MSKNPLPVPERIRNRRQALGLAAKDVARRAGFSPSYMSLIEQGRKVPSEEIAVRIAEALKDDPEIYRAWSQASRMGDLPETMQRMMRVHQMRSDPEARRRIGSGKRLGDALSDAMRETTARALEKLAPREASPDFTLMSRLAGKIRGGPVGSSAGVGGSGKGNAHDPRFARASDRARRMEKLPTLSAREEQIIRGRDDAERSMGRTLFVPLLEDSVDPGDDPLRCDGIMDMLRIDPRVLPEGIERTFAYRPSARTVERVKWSIRAGDLVVLAEAPDEFDPGGIYAVRHEGKTVLSWVVRHGTTLTMLPSPDGGEPISIDGGSEEGLRDLIAGIVVATVRTWPASEPAGADVAATETGNPVAASFPYPRRSMRVDGQFLVGDCEWKDKYGWRPIHRPEDMDWLDAHPGYRIRFRLMREGKVRFVLEMTADEWREALGSYYSTPGWRRNGYVVAVTKMREGEYTEEFQERWGRLVRGG